MTKEVVVGKTARLLFPVVVWLSSRLRAVALLRASAKAGNGNLSWLSYMDSRHFLSGIYVVRIFQDGYPPQTAGMTNMLRTVLS